MDEVGIIELVDLYPFSIGKKFIIYWEIYIVSKLISSKIIVPNLKDIFLFLHTYFPNVVLI